MGHFYFILSSVANRYMSFELIIGCSGRVTVCRCPINKYLRELENALHRMAKRVTLIVILVKELKFAANCLLLRQRLSCILQLNYHPSQGQN